jgi:hypothetical protein
MGFFSWLEKRRQKKEERRIVDMAIQNIGKLKESIDLAFENPIYFHHYPAQMNTDCVQKRKEKKEKKKNRRSGIRKKFTGNVGKYIKDRCYFDDNVKVELDYVYEDYVDWAQKNGLNYCKTTNSFGRELKVVEKGKFFSIRDEGKVIYKRLGIRNFVGDLFE